MKLFVTDIDDTLSVGEVVSEEVQQACRRLKMGGWDIMIATGRTFGTAKNHIAAAGATQPAILYDGSRLMTPEGEDIHASLFDSALALHILKTLWDFPFEIQVSGDEEIHCRENDSETSRFYVKAGVPVHIISEPCILGPVYRIGLWLRAEHMESMEERLKELFKGKVEVTPGGSEFLDLLPSGVSKGSTLERFVATLPSRPEVIVAAGDHKNDLEMLRYADVAVVPRNASSALMPVADIVMPMAREHGIHHLADHLLSGRFEKKRSAKPLYI